MNDKFYGCRLCNWPNEGCEYFIEKRDEENYSSNGLGSSSE